MYSSVQFSQSLQSVCLAVMLFTNAGVAQHDPAEARASAAWQATELSHGVIHESLFDAHPRDFNADADDRLTRKSEKTRASRAPQPPRELRHSIRLERAWKTVLGDPAGAEQPEFDDGGWKTVQLLHNWEDYQGYTRSPHGNLHGTAWYRRELWFDRVEPGRRCFIRFEGVGSYATVWLNGRELGRHAGGRTSFTFDLTDAIDFGGRNILAVRAEHPPRIADLPYVCGGCWGAPNTEGSQPFGIFRPVSIEITNPVRVAPFGVQLWTPEISARRAVLRVNTAVANCMPAPASVSVRVELLAAKKSVCSFESSATLIPAGATRVVAQTSPPIAQPRLWSLEDPFLHYVRCTVLLDGQPADQVYERFGFRWIEWPVSGAEDGRAESAAVAIDPLKLAEQPGPENNFFVRNTRADARRLDRTSNVRVQPGGVRVLIPQCSENSATIRILTTVKNEGGEPRRVIVVSFIVNHDGTKFLYSLESERELAPGETHTFDQSSPPIHFPERWSAQYPYLHVVDTSVVALKQDEQRKPLQDQRISDKTATTFGIFETAGPANKGDAFVRKSRPRDETARDPRFLLNGKPVFINGTCEYEHLLGNDHAFTDEQIYARMMQIKAAGFNAFRDAHHPHNLRYLELCDELGLLCWTQLSTHVYFDNEAFRENFRNATREWVRERRNSPAIVLWGIQNESALPTVFAREITAIVRELDPTTSGQRKTTTCNGGTGTDWNVPQNWLGTYGGNVNDYAPKLLDQRLAGEYGQWRTLGLHQEGDWRRNWKDKNDWERVIPEELFTYSLETKVRIAEEIRDEVCGHFQWIFNTHANPGRGTENCRDGLPPNNVGVANYKGLISSWGEPVDAYFMYRANYARAETEPMVYICSHTWPDRWNAPGVKSDIVVFSNCDTVELFNDFKKSSLGRKSRGATGTHFEWDNVNVEYDTLYAAGRVNGRVRATDIIKLRNLPPAPKQARAEAKDTDNTRPRKGAKYFYRVNCGGPDYTDVHGNLWQADRDFSVNSEQSAVSSETEVTTGSKQADTTVNSSPPAASLKLEVGKWGSLSWTAIYPKLEPRYASQARVYDPIRNTRDDELHQTFRYGREQLRFLFGLPDGEYQIELYFIEPWHGAGGGSDCTGWRLFDVAVSGRTVLDDFDLWQAAGGHARAVKQIVTGNAVNGVLEVSFPEVKSDQAVISAIAIRTGADRKDEWDR